jgi:hypothetical protein
VAYADEPCIAVVEINNEHAMSRWYFSGQFDQLPAPDAAELQRQWNEWLTPNTKLFTGFPAGRTIAMGDVALEIGKTRLAWATVSLVSRHATGFGAAGKPANILLAASGVSSGRSARPCRPPRCLPPWSHVQNQTACLSSPPPRHHLGLSRWGDVLAALGRQRYSTCSLAAAAIALEHRSTLASSVVAGRRSRGKRFWC